MSMDTKGKLINMEGTDGSGKATQTKLLLERLKKEGYKTHTISFPRYGQESAREIEEYLKSAFGDPDKVDPYKASMFYAHDRADASSEIYAALKTGYVVVLNRYVDSNAGHQGGKIKDLKAREKFLRWLYKTEYAEHKIPRPDLVLILHLSAQVGQALALAVKDKKADAHEANLQHLKNAEAAYLWLAQKFPEDHKIIECLENGKILTPEKIHELVWKEIKKIL